MRILFFFVHPAKYYLFRNTINRLKEEGHTVDIAIISKDILEELIIQEGWKYVNIFKGGRRSSFTLPLLIYVFTLINFIKTVIKLFILVGKKKYSVYITDDCLTIIGYLKKIPTLMFIDDDIEVVSENRILLETATKVIAPECTRLGKYSGKKIAFKGYKELAYLSPKYFTPNIEKIKVINPQLIPYAVLRLVSLTASHDAGKNGINDNQLQKIISTLERKYKVYITSERPINNKLEHYRINLPIQDIAHLLYFAEMFIGDSQTMTSEAAILGTPAIRINDFVGSISVMEEKEFKYDLSYGFKPDNFDAMIKKIEYLMNKSNLKKEWEEKKLRMLEDCDDVNQILYTNIISISK